ncbi:pyridoxal-phosphate dependent enzyme [Kineosporia sp. J2-2]|uniref:Pyridoxal-phosphate dependent enzyme n=1 Tax=Kineosporia corallincola TaxID=2835133 RepID=A0ABS5TEB8_9ACTN|nr:pyridoxal-phosphate dependent enzyme [Kineosporia corallincola]MBT0769428.1 pyridoxal-phosphate dependent enzyme [Kineosporia corallincola]
MTSTAPRLGSYPTPLEPAPRLAAALGLHPGDLWIKRDDLIGLGGGGNKVRKLEHTLAAALADGAGVVITSGAAQSNHARLTAAAAARAGLRAVLVLTGQAPAVPVGNLLLDHLFGAEIVWAGDLAPAALGERVAQEAERLRAAGDTVAVIPFGGSSPLGALGYAEAGTELLGQEPELDRVVVAVGSGGTMAGLVHALGAARVLGVDVGALADPVAAVAGLLHAMGGAADGLVMRRDQVGEGYAVVTPAVREAISLTARTEGVVLDPVYTGRAAAGLVAAVADGTVRAGERTVLLHTGGLPGLFGHTDAASLAGDG